MKKSIVLFLFPSHNNFSEMVELRDQVKAIKKELKDEMKNIKQVMTSLFEVQQRTLVRY